MKKYSAAIKIITILFGTFLMAISINMFLIPSNILSGGVTGIAVLLHLLFGFDTHFTVPILNIPLFIIAYFYMKKRFVVFSLIGMLSLSFFLFLTNGLHYATNDIIVTVISGGILSGFGSGIIFKFNGSTGGGDIIAKLAYKYGGYSISSIVFLINFIIVFLSIYFFGLNIAVYTMATMFISSQVSKFVIDGLNYKKAVFIISDHYMEISETILKQLKRGVTSIQVSGAYTHTSKYMLYCIVGIREVAQLKLLVKTIDPKAFMTITQTSQVIGNGRGFIDIKSED